MHLVNTRSDICFVVNMLSQFEVELDEIAKLETSVCRDSNAAGNVSNPGADDD